jgi:uncharacterized membrane protein YfcA
MIGLVGVVLIAVISYYRPNENAFYVSPDVFGALFIALAIAMLEHTREAEKAIKKNVFEVMAEGDKWYYAGLGGFLSNMLGVILAGFHIEGLLMLAVLFVAIVTTFAMFILTGSLVLVFELPKQRQPSSG